MKGTKITFFSRLGRKERLFFTICWLLGALALGLVWWAKGHPDWVEQYYSLWFYPRWAGVLAALTTPVPFSLAEWIVILAAVGALVFLIRSIWIIAHKKGERSYLLLLMLFRAGGAAALVLFFFTLSGGLNYYRYPFSFYSGLEVKESPVSQLTALCQELADTANQLRSGLQEDQRGVYTYAPASHWEMSEQAMESYQALINANPQWEQLLTLAGRVRPKPVFFSEAMSYMQIVGVFFPYTMEANVNIHTSDIDIPHAMCHELCHIAGFMREDEANFIAYLACRESASKDFQYSGTMTALIHATNALYGVNTESYRQVMATLSDQVMLDLQADSEYYQAHKSSFGEFSTKVNDVYLKANSQSDGVASYGRMVDLLLADYRARRGIE